jgi:outer membrane protein assembly factor BamB
MPWLRSLALLVLACAPAAAADWPQWLGPDRDNSTPETVAVWKEAPKVLWRQPVGEGNGSPVVSGGRVFVHGKVKDQNKEEVVAYDAGSGREVWRVAYERAKFSSLYGNGPRATPAVADGRVYTFGITGVLTCFEAATGKQLWQVDTLKDLGAKNLFFGMSCSPLVEGDFVLENVGARGASVVAFDRLKGTVAWKALDDKASYSSPIAFGKGKGRQVVFLTGDGVVSLSPADGSLFWRFPLKDTLLESSTTPVRVGDTLVASSITYGSAGLRLQTKDGKPAYKEEWKDKSLTCYFSTPVAVGTDHLYMVTGSNPLAFNANPTATLHCVEAATGKSLWKKERIGKYHAALLRTGDGKLLLLDDAGELALLNPDPKGYRELARSKVCGPTWAHPALSDGRLYVRDEKELICLKLAQ